MTTYFNFQPAVNAQYKFQPTLDGNVYQASVPWLLFGARYYLNLVALDGTPIWYGAVVGSPDGLQIEALSWANGIVTVTTAIPHGYRIASTVTLNIVGCAPSAFNGQNLDVMATGPNTFSYLLPNDPGQATSFGFANFDINMIGGVPDGNGAYFSSSLVYRQSTSNFEVNP